MKKLGLAVDQSNGQILIDWNKIPFSENDRPYWAALSSISGVGPNILAVLITAFGSARQVFKQSSASLNSIGLAEKVIDRLVDFRKMDFEKYFQKLSGSDGNRLTFITPGEKNFSPLLAKISHGPSQIWVWGNSAALLAKYPVAVVGTRKITPYGREITMNLSGRLAARGCTIVSGLMYGVDEAAMRAALKTGGLVIGVWAGGISRRSLGSRWRLARDIVDHKGVVISEFSLNQLPDKGLFPVRNRIVSGLSRAVIVTEGAVKSGSLITARCAVEQGRPVFAVPGPITSDFSAGPNELLKLGAQPLTSAQDIFDILNITQSSSATPQFIYRPKNNMEELIISLLSKSALSADELVRLTRLQPNKLAESLINLEMLNVVGQSSGLWQLSN